jgi:hypothetical protein
MKMGTVFAVCLTRASKVGCHGLYIWGGGWKIFQKVWWYHPYTWFEAEEVDIVPVAENVVVIAWGATALEPDTSSFVDVSAGDDNTAGVAFEVTTELIDVVLNDDVCRTHGSSGPWWFVVTVTVGDETTAAGVLTGALTGADDWTEFRWLLDEGDDWTGIRVYKYKSILLFTFWAKFISFAVYLDLAIRPSIQRYKSDLEVQSCTSYSK